MKRLQALKVLLVEDNQGDVLLLRAALDADQLSTFELTTVDLLEDGLRQLQQAHFDIALVDLALPDSLGLETFERIHRASPEMPVVVFSGNEDEEQAVDAVRLGAQDYLVKSLSGFDMAARTIRYAIERNKLHNNLRESEARFSILFRSNPVPMGITRASDYSIVDVNDVWTNLTGYTRDEALGHTAAELGLVKPDILQQVRNKLAEWGEIHQLEIPFYNRNGEERRVLISSESLVLGREAYVLNNLVDITERKQAEEKLRATYDQLSKIISTSPGIVCSFQMQPDGSVRVPYGGDRIAEHYGIPHVQLAENAAPWLALTHPADLDDLQASIAESARDLSTFRHEWRVRHPIRGEVWIEAHSIPEREPDGSTLWYGVATDITERKQAEDALKESEARFSKVFFTNPVSQAILSTITGQVMEVNDACCHLYEYSREELIGTDPGSLDLWANPADQLDVLEELQRTGHLLPREIMIRPRSGETRTILFSVEQINWKGEPCLISSSVDISARKLAESKIQEQLLRLKSLHLIDQAISTNSSMEETLNVILQQTKELLAIDAAAILLFDEQKQLLECTACQGFSSQDVRNAQLKLSEGYAGRAMSERHTVHIPNLLETGSPLADSLKTAGDDLLDYYGTPMISKGKVLGILEIYFHAPINPNNDWIIFFEMIAGQAAIAIENSQLLDGLMRSTQELELRVKTRTADLLRVNAELENANRTKDEFLANMSHELRTPLTGILGMAETLQLGTYGQLSEKQVKSLQTIETSGRHLLNLINDILDLSKIEAGKFDIYPEMISLNETCRESLLFVKELAHKKSIVLDYQGPNDVKSVFADPRRLKQILINLLSNAVKFTPEKGHVTLTVRTDPEKEQIHFVVIDTGIGIAQTDLDRLFTPFTQVDSRLNRQYEGTGLGLALVLRLAEMHGGSVQVESDGVPGKGSRFTVSLPWQPQVVKQAIIPNEEIQLQTPEQVTPNSRGVLLLAEDSPTNILAIGDYLQFKGYTLVVASNGMEALVKAEENDPDLILVDIQMPVMDGLEATRRLRADSRFASTPIIALTALAMPGDREKCIQAGANDYLSKPVRLKELAEKIEKLLQ